MKEKMNIVASIIGGIFGYLFGGLDVLLEVFCMIFILDTCSGMLKHYGKGTYESKKFREGLKKKCGYMLAIILSVQLDRLMGDSGTLRSALLFCLIANEGTSIVENLGQMGVPIPPSITNSIAVLKNRSDETGDKIPHE